MTSNFFSFVSRMKYINRWGLMNNTKYENLSEHSMEVAMFAHALVVIANKRCNKNLDANRAALLGLYHDASEIITGDMPTPIKYLNNDIKTAYKSIEAGAEKELLSLLPDYLRDEYKDIISIPDDDELKVYVKAADKLSALVKCIEEIKMSNKEFEKALDATKKSLKNMKLEALDIFMKEFLPSYYDTIDETR